MFTPHRRSGALALAAALCLACATQVQAAGLLRPKYGAIPALTLQSHVVNVVVEDGYAVTTIEQVFANPHPNDLEAIYSFPVPENAAVSDFAYWIDGKPVVGEVVEKARARTLYEQEKAAGRDTALAEQDDYKTFDMRVFPVRAQDDVRIRMSYIQPAHVDLGVGRYVYPLEDGGVDDQRLAFWSTDPNVQAHFEFSLWLRLSRPLAAVRLPSHPDAQVIADADGSYRVRIAHGARPGVNDAVAEDENSAGQFGVVEASATGAAGAAFTLDQDIVVYWRLQDGLPGGIDVVTHKPAGTDHGVFMVTATPGAELQPIETTGGDWIFVVDTSGSMQRKMHSVRAGLSQAIDRLRPTDRARIVTFSERAQTFTDGAILGTPEGKAALKKAADGLVASGGTNLFAGVDLGLKQADADRTSAVVLITDGVANVGETQHKAFLKLLKRKDVRLFTFVMGNSANRPLLNSMTEVSGGEAFAVSNSDDIVGHVLSALSKVEHQALRDLSLSVYGVTVSDVAILDGGPLHRGEQWVAFGRYRGDGPGRLTLSGKIAGRRVRYDSPVTFPARAEDNPEIARLHSFAQVERLMEEIRLFGEGEERRAAIVDVAVDGGLVTPYTSMIVLREEAFDREGIDRRNARRVAAEQEAQARRAARAVQDRQADRPAPAFQGSRPSHGGGGAGNLGLLGLLLSAFLAKVRGRSGAQT